MTNPYPGPVLDAIMDAHRKATEDMDEDEEGSVFLFETMPALLHAEKQATGRYPIRRWNQ